MRWTLPIIVSFLLINEISAQCDSSFFRYTGTLIRGISLIDSSRIIAVGRNGYIIKSTDGGISWKNKQSSTANLLTAVQFIADSTVYAVGAENTILKSEDQGESWFPLYADIPVGFPLPPSYKFSDLFFLNKNKGFIVGEGGILLSTNDGGLSWKDTTMMNGLSSISFVNDSIGFICGGEGHLFKTKNGGTTWEYIDIGISGYNTFLTKIRFLNSTTGFVVGNGICMKTTDSGNTWTSINTPMPTSNYDVYFLDSLKGFIVTGGGAGSIWQTSNGGSTWTSVPFYPPGIASYYCINADPARKKIIIAGGGGGRDYLDYSGRNIISTIDAGTTFTSLSNNGGYPYYEAFFRNDSTGYIGGNNTVFKTNDYGESWKPLNMIPSALNGINNILFLDDLHGFVGTDNIYKTNDGGQSWLKTTTPLIGQSYINPLKIYFADTLKGIVEDRSSIYKTVDGGSTWTDVLTLSFPSFTDLAFTANGKGFAIGYPGILYNSTNEGSTWNKVDLSTSEFLSTIYFYNNQIGYIGTSNNSLYKTENGGTTWSKINTGIQNVTMRSFHFINDSVGYVMCNINQGAYSQIYITKNGGISWNIIKQVPEILYRFAGFKATYITGEYGMILKTTTVEKPGIPGYIYGADKACINNKSSFITGNMAGVNLTWLLADGGSNVYNANKDTVFWNSPGLHTLSVSASNACGSSLPRTTVIDVISFQPAITMQDSLLTATEGLAYQWYRNSSAIPDSIGGNSRRLVATLSGSYTVMVKSLYGCSVTTPAVIYTAPLKVSLCPNGNASIASTINSISYQWQLDNGFGFSNVSDNSVLSGTHSDVLHFTGVPSLWYDYKFRCITTGGSSEIYSLQFIDYWNGSVDGVWENPANWSCGKVPNANTDVIINSGTIVINSNVTIRKLTISSAVNLTIQPGNTLTVIH